MKYISTLLIALGLVACATTEPQSQPDHTSEGATLKHQHHDHHDHHDHRFQNPEDYVQSWNSPERDEWQRPDEVLRVLNLSGGETVADLGTGTGYFVPHLAGAVGENGKVLALDVEENMVKFVQESAKEKGLLNVETMKIPFDKTGVEPASLDRILTVNTWHHFENREAYSAHLKSILKPDGYLVVVDFTKDAPHGPPPAMRLAPEVVIAELEAGGFSAKLEPTELKRQFVIVARPK